MVDEAPMVGSGLYEMSRFGGAVEIGIGLSIGIIGFYGARGRGSRGFAYGLYGDEKREP